MASLEHFREKWHLTSQDRYFKKFYQRLGDKRYNAFLRPFVRDLSFGQTNIWLENRLKPIERSLNHYLTRRHKENLMEAK